jgi:hypothetical protein
VLPDGTRLRTLRQAISHLAKTVLKAERDMTEVQTAAEMLTNVAERESAWMFFVRIGVLRALIRCNAPRQSPSHTSRPD